MEKKKLKIKDIEETIESYEWLCRNKKSYQKYIALIREEKKYFLVHGIQYSARSTTSMMELNEHLSINPKFILEGLEDAVVNMDKEIGKIVEKLEKAGIEVEK